MIRGLFGVTITLRIFKGNKIMELTPNNVEDILFDCLFEKEEDVTDNNMVSVEGVVFSYGLRKDKVQHYEKDIINLLQQLSPDFSAGASFLQMCQTKEKEIWTGDQKLMNSLLCLGLAIGKIQYCTKDKRLWDAMPGGMPYIFIFPSGTPSISGVLIERKKED